MKVALITTLPELEENKRICDEVKALGHDFQLINLENFSFQIGEKGLRVEGLGELDAEVVIVRGIFSSIKPIANLVEHLRSQGMRVFDNNFLEHKYSIDKVSDLMKLSFKGVAVPQTYYSRSFEGYPAVCEEIGYPVVIKSVRAGKGASVFKLENETELYELIENLREGEKEAKSYLIQEYIDYQYDLRCLIIGEHVFTMRRIPAEGEFRANFSLGGSVELFDLDQEGQELAIRALQTVNMSVGGVDVLIDKTGKKRILEVNHTAGFVGMEKATGENIGKIWVEHALNSAK